MDIVDERKFKSWIPVTAQSALLPVIAVYWRKY